MDEDIVIINNNTRQEKIKNFLVKNKNKLIFAVLVLGIILISVYSIDKYKIDKKNELSNKFSLATLDYSKNTKENTINKLVEIINEQDSTYSPLSLYFIIDNKLISDQDRINIFFDTLIDKTSLDQEIKNLIIYKKALFNVDQANENDLLNMLKPLINTQSVWKSHALYIIAEYFYSKGQNEKSKEFFNQIISLENPNSDIRLLAERRLNRDLSE